MPAYTLQWNGTDIKPGASVTLPGVLRVTVPEWQSVSVKLDWNKVNYGLPWNSRGVHELKPLDAGTHVVEIVLNSSEWFGFTVNVLPAQVTVPPVSQADVQEAGGQIVSSPIDGKGGTVKQIVRPNTSDCLLDIRKGGSLANMTMATLPRPDPTKANPHAGVYMSGDGTSASGIALADGSGWGFKVNGAGVKLTNLSAATFTDYLVYGELAKDLTISGVKVKGGSTCESILRFDDCTGTLEDFDLDYTTATRKACIRGAFTGSIRNGKARGGVVGLNPLGGMDGGQCYGITKFLTPAGIVTVADDKWAGCLSIVKTSGKNAAGIASLCAAFAQIANADIDATLKRRAMELAKRSNVEWANVTIEHSIRWEAGTTYRYTGGTIDGTLNGGDIFNNPLSVYPEPGYVLPGDVVRPAPDITFTGTAFVGNFNIGRDSVKLVDCTLNGKAF